MAIEQIPKPDPAVGQALVKIKAFGLNRMDLLQREGLYPLPPQAPETMGVEFSGTVESLGEDTECGFKAGDAVFGLAYGGWYCHLLTSLHWDRPLLTSFPGAYAEYIVVDTGMLIHKPAEISWEQAAGVPEVRNALN